MLALMIAFFVFLMGIVCGWKIYPKMRPCPVVTSDTLIIRDTVWHTIVDSFPMYVAGKDSIIYRDSLIYANVDTAQILKDWYAIHIYDREWKDTNIVVTMKDFITQNKSVHNVFNYKILRPQTIIQNNIDNSIHYNKYVTLGISVPFKEITHVNLDARYQWSKGYIGTFYSSDLKSFGVSGGVVLFKLK